MTPSRFLVPAALAAWLLGGTGCSVLLQTDAQQCTVDADCTARGAAFAGTVCSAGVCVPKEAGAPDPKWACIGTGIPLPSGSMATFELQFVDLITTQPVTQNLTVALCNKYDTTCMTPLTMLTPDTTGTVTSTVATSFEGYVDVTDTTGNYLPSLVFIDLAVIAKNGQVLLIPKSAESALATTADITVDPTAGLLLMGTDDCTGARSAGVSVSMSPVGKETGFYLINDAAETTATMTDSSGNSGFINVAAPSNVIVTGTVAATGTPMGQVTTLVRPGTMTYQLVRPTTNP
jgi:hypothetical protein